MRIQTINVLVYNLTTTLIYSFNIYKHKLQMMVSFVILYDFEPLL